MARIFGLVDSTCAHTFLRSGRDLGHSVLLPWRGVMSRREGEFQTISLRSISHWLAVAPSVCACYIFWLCFLSPQLVLDFWAS